MKIGSNEAIGLALRDARLALGISQEGIAEVLGVSPSILNRVEHGRRAFDTDWLPLLPPAAAAAVREAIVGQVDAEMVGI